MLIYISCVTACHESNLSSTFQISDLVAYVGGFTILGFAIGIYLYHRPLVDINDSQMIVVLELLQTQVSETAGACACRRVSLGPPNINAHDPHTVIPLRRWHHYTYQTTSHLVHIRTWTSKVMFWLLGRRETIHGVHFYYIDPTRAACSEFEQFRAHTISTSPQPEGQRATSCLAPRMHASPLGRRIV